MLESEHQNSLNPKESSFLPEGGPVVSCVDLCSATGQRPLNNDPPSSLHSVFSSSTFFKSFFRTATGEVCSFLLLTCVFCSAHRLFNKNMKIPVNGSAFVGPRWRQALVRTMVFCVIVWYVHVWQTEGNISAPSGRRITGHLISYCPIQSGCVDACVSKRVGGATGLWAFWFGLKIRSAGRTQTASISLQMSTTLTYENISTASPWLDRSCFNIQWWKCQSL